MSPAADDRPVFYYGLGSPYAYLAAERASSALPVVPVWQPVLAHDLGAAGAPAAGAEGPSGDRSAVICDVERRAAAQGLPPLRWPVGWPAAEPELAVRAAIFAQASGRVVAFSLAALRQAFAGGRDLADVDTVLLAGAACELHPRAVLKGIESRAVRDRLAAATAAAHERGVAQLPAVAAGDRVFAGPDALDEAARALASASIH